MNPIEMYIAKIIQQFEAAGGTPQNYKMLVAKLLRDNEKNPELARSVLLAAHQKEQFLRESMEYEALRHLFDLCERAKRFSSDPAISLAARTGNQVAMPLPAAGTAGGAK